MQLYRNSKYFLNACFANKILYKIYVLLTGESESTKKIKVPILNSEAIPTTDLRVWDAG